MINIQHSRDFYKGIRKADSLVAHAIKERNRRGYRENLGYDLDNKLENYLSTLELTYTEKANIIQHFYNACDNI